ncbi:MAG: Hvo_1808 family surface protein [Halobacteriaceae archaeon]
MEVRLAVLGVVLVGAALVPASVPGAGVGAGGGIGDGVAQTAAPPDPSHDVLGWEQGYWYNESIDVDQSDGLSEAELDAFVARSMARVEVIRRREFRRDVPVSVVSRSAFRNRSQTDDATTPYGAWNNQVWEALFVVGEDTDVQRELQQTTGSAVAGFYSPADDEIKIITPTPDSPTIDNATLVHELTHALQDQYVNLSDPRFSPPTQDASLAADGLVEGEANYVEHQYARRCTGEWTCVRPPRGGGGGAEGPLNLGLLLTILQPYSDGPPYVAHLRERGGWDALDYEHPPASTEQVIHRVDEPPAPMSFEDRSNASWHLFPDQGVDGYDTVGEASVYMMFFEQSRNFGAGVVDVQAFFSPESDLDLYDYTSKPSAGWGNDRVYPYHRGNGSDAAYGYVWKTAWDTEADAEQFRAAYRKVLAAQDAERVGDGTWVVPDGPYADAFHVARDGTTVTVVNAPTVGDLSGVRSSVDATNDTTNDTTSPTGTTTDGMPGFTGATALLAVGAALAALVAARGWER